MKGVYKSFLCDNTQGILVSNALADIFGHEDTFENTAKWLQNGE